MVSTVTRPVIIHRSGGGGGQKGGYVLKWMLWRRWHSFEKVEAALICTACHKSAIHAFLAALSQFYHGLSDYESAEPFPASSLFTLFILSLSLQPVRWVSISRWRVMACVVNVLNTATQRPELPSPAPVTPTTIEQQMTRQQLHAPVSTNTRYTRSSNPTGNTTSKTCAHKHWHTSTIDSNYGMMCRIYICLKNPIYSSDQTCEWTRTLSFFSPGPPSAPVNVISSVNGTSVNLEWDRPLDTGGRSDLQYSVLCQKCSGEGGPCEDCASSPGGAGGGKVGGGASFGAVGGGIVERLGTAAVRFVPRQTGLTEPWVTVLNLVAHTNYSFRILARNAVTHLSNEPSLYALVNITTNQAGRVQNNDIQYLIKAHRC